MYLFILWCLIYGLTSVESFERLDSLKINICYVVLVKDTLWVIDVNSPSIAGLTTSPVC